MSFGTTTHTRNVTRTLTHVGLRNGMRNIMDTKIIRRLTRNQTHRVLPYHSIKHPWLQCYLSAYHGQGQRPAPLSWCWIWGQGRCCQGQCDASRLLREGTPQSSINQEAEETQPQEIKAEMPRVTRLRLHWRSHAWLLCQNNWYCHSKSEFCAHLSCLRHL